MVDLGKWITEEYRVKGAPADVGSEQEVPNADEENDEEK